MDFVVKILTSAACNVAGHFVAKPTKEAIEMLHHNRRENFRSITTVKTKVKDIEENIRKSILPDLDENEEILVTTEEKVIFIEDIYGKLIAKLEYNKYIVNS